MRPLEVAILDTSLVDGHMVEQGGLLGCCKERRLHGRIGQDHVGCDADQARDDTQDHKHHLPSSECWVGDMLEPIGNDASEDLTYTQTAVPDAKSRCLFRFSVPLAADQH